MDHFEPIAVGGLDLEVEAMGDGEPIVVIQTALTADELRPLARQLALTGEYRVIHYHRRGYAGSGPPAHPGSMAADAADCRALVGALGLAPAHIVGVSYSAAVALTLASSAPESVASLTVMEAPPQEGAGAEQFRAASTALLETFRASGPLSALDDVMTALAGSDWREESERDQPGSVAAMERDAVSFFESDVPALLSWRFGVEEAGRIRCPVLYVGGDRSGPWFADVRAHLLRLLPHAEDAAVPGAGHLLALTHTREASRLVADFVRRHPRSALV